MMEGVAITSFCVHFQFICAFQVVEEDPNYWDAMSSALAVGWLETVVSILNVDIDHNNCAFKFLCLCDVYQDFV